MEKNGKKTINLCSLSSASHAKAGENKITFHQVSLKQTNLNGTCCCKHLSDAGKNLVHQVMRTFKNQLRVHI